MAEMKLRRLKGARRSTLEVQLDSVGLGNLSDLRGTRTDLSILSGLRLQSDSWYEFSQQNRNVFNLSRLYLLLPSSSYYTGVKVDGTDPIPGQWVDDTENAQTERVFNLQRSKKIQASRVFFCTKHSESAE